MPIRLLGTTSGYIEIDVPAVANNGTVVFSQTASGSMVSTGDKNTFTRPQVIDSANTEAALLATRDSNETGYTVVMEARQGTNLAGTNYSRMSFGQLSTNDMFIEVADQSNVKGDFCLQPYGGNIGIGTTAPLQLLDVRGLGQFRSTGLAAGISLVNTLGNRDFRVLQKDAGYFSITDETAQAERLSILSTGEICIGGTAVDPSGTNGAGHALSPVGYISSSRSGGTTLSVNRKTNDGNIVELRQDGVLEGTISVSGTTVSYSAFAGSHWSQLTDNSRPDILRGTVVETIDEKCEWQDQQNDQLAKFKISDTIASKRVYGVFMTWDNDDQENNDAYIVGLGAYLIRVAANVTVQGGDLLESNGDGCARVQADDLIRSSTIGKVTCNIPTETYEDGSYTVPCVLYCG